MNNDKLSAVTPYTLWATGDVAHGHGGPSWRAVLRDVQNRGAVQ